MHILRLLAACVATVLVASAEVNRSWDVLVTSIETGKSVVVTRMNSGNVEGKLLAIDADSITVKWHGEPQVIQKADVFRVRYANIRRKHTLIGMAIGAGTGAIIGATGVEYDKGGVAAFGSLLGVGFGALGGGVLPIGAPLYQLEKPAKRADAARR